MIRYATIFAAFIASCLLAVPSIGTAQEQPDLTRAYKKEFAYLQAQKKALQQRVDELKQQTRDKVAASQGEVDRLQGRLVALTQQADELEEQLGNAQQEVTMVEDRSDTLLNTYEQARTSLKTYGVELAEPAGEQVTADEMKAAFARAHELIAEGGSVRTTNGEFFLQDGSQAKGKVVRVGRVAAYGVSESAAGALAPAGEGRLKIWPKDSAATARAVASGEQPRDIAIFLFENADTRVEEKEGKTLMGTLEAGGIIAYVIVGIGLLALLLVLLRFFILFGIAGRSESLLERVKPHVVAGDLDKAQAVAKQAKGPTAEVVLDTLQNLHRKREVLEDMVSESMLRQIPKVERFGAAIMVFAAVSPLLGLLGTVTGMISTFDIITEYGTGDPKLLSSGISEALITTQLGLVVAIPALLLGNLLNGRANTVMNEMEQGALQLINVAEKAGTTGMRAPTGAEDGSPEESAAE
jgi:biopolymer transport protein ExbB